MKKILIIIIMLFSLIWVNAQYVEGEYGIFHSTITVDDSVATVYQGVLPDVDYVQSYVASQISGATIILDTIDAQVIRLDTTGTYIDSSSVTTDTVNAKLILIGSSSAVIDSTSITIDSVFSGYVEVGNSIVDSTSVTTDTINAEITLTDTLDNQTFIYIKKDINLADDIALSDNSRLEWGNNRLDGNSSSGITINLNTGAGDWRFTKVGINGLYNIQSTNGAAMLGETPSATNPVFSFNGDDNTGIGRHDADTLSIIGGGVQSIKAYANGMYSDTITALKGKFDTLDFNGATITDTIDLKSAVEAEVFDSIDAILLKVGRIERDTIYHAIGGFEDSTITITISASNTWYMITNTSKNAFVGLDSAGFTFSGDTLIALHSGKYHGKMSITFSGTVGNEYQFRGYNVTQGRQLSFKQGCTADGIAVYRNIMFPLFENVTAGDKFIMQVENISASNNVILRHMQFEATYLSE